MSEEKNKITPAPAPQPKDGIFSLEDLDKIIEAEDPGFKSDLDKLKATPYDATVLDESLNIAIDETEALAKSEEDIESLPRWKKIIVKFKNKLVKPLYQLPGRLWLRCIAAYHRMLYFLQKVLHFFKNDFKDYLKYLFSQLKSFIAHIKAIFLKIKALSLVQKLKLFGLLVISAFSFVLIFNLIIGRNLPELVSHLPKSMAPYADSKGRFVEEDLIQFYEAFPEVEFPVLIKKIISNLKPDRVSGPNPMGAFEMYLSLDSQDTAIEVKDREKEIIDVIQRTIEGFEYSVIRTKQGKTRLKEALKSSINELLNQGSVFEIYFSMFVLYQQ
jgi:hypothetical protein